MWRPVQAGRHCYIKPVFRELRFPKHHMPLRGSRGRLPPNEY
jgi:hypothetical protein